MPTFNVPPRKSAEEARTSARGPAAGPVSMGLGGLGGLVARAGWVRRSDADLRWQALFEASTEGLVVCDAQGAVLAANAALAGLLAQVPTALVGEPLMRWIEQPKRPPRGGFPLVAGEASLRQAQGPARSVDLRVSPLPGYAGLSVSGNGDGQWLITLRDNTDRRKTQERLNFLANFDSLTGLPNRALFRDRLAQAMARAQRSRKTMALMFMDLDRFKLVNDGLGHEVGDTLLQHVAKTLAACLRDVDTVTRQVDCEPCVLSRLGGDEFTVIAENIGGAEDATHIACRLLDALQVPIKMGVEEVVISASIGISLYPTDDVDLDGLIKHTDMAMYRSKSMGRGTYSFFSDELNAAMSARLSLEGSLRRAVERHEFLLHYQPKANLASGTVTGVEALLRWQCPRQGLVPPDKFIGVLEDTGMILPVGAWVIRSACKQLAEWDRMGLPKLRMAVNLSARQFRHLFLASMIQDTLAENAIDPARLEIELTESLLMEDSDSTRSMLESFSRMGVRLAIDDFGTGHSSLSYLKRFNIDTLKVDRSFVSSLPDSLEDKAIATAVIALARSFDMSVVAEGVETHAQAEMLKNLGCDEMQGYLLSRPLPAATLEKWLTSRLREEQQNRLSLGGKPGEGLQRMALNLPTAR